MSTQPLYHGGLCWVTPIATAITTDTPAKASGTTIGMDCFGFSHEPSNRLVYKGNTGRTFKVLITASLTKASGTTSLSHVYIYKNGVKILGEVGRTLANSTDEGAFALATTVTMRRGDYVECWITLDTNDDVTVQSGTMIADCIG